MRERRELLTLSNMDKLGYLNFMKLKFYETHKILIKFLLKIFLNYPVDFYCFMNFNL